MNTTIIEELEERIRQKCRPLNMKDYYQLGNDYYLWEDVLTTKEMLIAELEESLLDWKDALDDNDSDAECKVIELHIAEEQAQLETLRTHRF